MDTSFGISTSFEVLSPSEGQVAYALLTRLPLTFPIASYRVRPFDLHVLSTPPAFVLSQDQTLYKLYLNSVSTVQTFTELFVIASKTFYPYSPR